MNRLRGTRYIDRRTASNIANMGCELEDIADRLKLFGFVEEAAEVHHYAGKLMELGHLVAEKIGDQRLRVETGEKT